MQAILTCTKCGQESKAKSNDEFKFVRVLIEISDELLAHDEICKSENMHQRKNIVKSRIIKDNFTKLHYK